MTEHDEYERLYLAAVAAREARIQARLALIGEEAFVKETREAMERVRAIILEHITSGQ